MTEGLLTTPRGKIKHLVFVLYFGEHTVPSFAKKLIHMVFVPRFRTAAAQGGFRGISPPQEKFQLSFIFIGVWLKQNKACPFFKVFSALTKFC